MALSNRFVSDALRDLQRSLSVFDQPFFNSFVPSTLSGGSHNHHLNSFMRFPATDIVEKSEVFEVQAELPGYEKNNIKIEMPDSHTLVLSGFMSEQHEVTTETEQQQGEQQEQQQAASTSTSSSEETQVTQKKKEDSQVAAFKPHYWMNERVSGSFSRTFRFPNPVQTDSIKARFDNGVLKVTVPKVTKTESKQIQIE